MAAAAWPISLASTSFGTGAESMERSKALQIYMKPGIREDDLMLRVWEACRKHDRPQDVFRTMLRAGLRAMYEGGELPDAVIEDCGLDGIFERRRGRSARSRQPDGQTQPQPPVQAPATPPAPPAPPAPHPQQPYYYPPYYPYPHQMGPDGPPPHPGAYPHPPAPVHHPAPAPASAPQPMPMRPAVEAVAAETPPPARQPEPAPQAESARQESPPAPPPAPAADGQGGKKRIGQLM